jgi:3-ketoacyl-CoA synthase
MAREQERFSTEIANQGVDNNAGSFCYSVKVRPRLPDFLSSVNLKYVKLGYSYLLRHSFYFLVAPVLIVIFGVELRKLSWEDFYQKCDLTDALFMMGLLGLILYIYLDLTPRSIYLVDFACYRPPNELKVSILDKFLLNALNIEFRIL